MSRVHTASTSPSAGQSASSRARHDARSTPPSPPLTGVSWRLGAPGLAVPASRTSGAGVQDVARRCALPSRHRCRRSRPTPRPHSRRRSTRSPRCGYRARSTGWSRPAGARSRRHRSAATTSLGGFCSAGIAPGEGHEPGAGARIGQCRLQRSHALGTDGSAARRAWIVGASKSGHGRLSLVGSRRSQSSKLGIALQIGSIQTGRHMISKYHDSTREASNSGLMSWFTPLTTRIGMSTSNSAVRSTSPSTRSNRMSRSM